MGITSPTDSSSTWRDRFKAFMEGGSCKESYRAFEYSSEETHREALKKCMKTHSDYYQPVSSAYEKSNEQFVNDVVATFMPSTLLDQTKEVDAKIEEELERFSSFMKGGGCKESFTTWYDTCIEDDSEKNNDEDHDNKCGRLVSTMMRCQCDHSDYYQPFLSVIKSSNDQLDTELEALFSKES